jgi:hypothetical protein
MNAPPEADSRCVHLVTVPSTLSGLTGRTCGNRCVDPRKRDGLASDFTICYSEPKMLANGKRVCDVCYREIKEGEKYIAHKIEKGHVPLALVERDVDAQGNVQLDILEWTPFLRQPVNP